MTPDDEQVRVAAAQAVLMATQVDILEKIEKQLKRIADNV